MELTEYFSAEKAYQEALCRLLSGCEWSAGPYLARLLRENTFAQTMGPNGRIYFLWERGQVAAYAALTEKDCIDDPALHPWIGFVYTAPPFRGRRYSGRLIAQALSEARARNEKRVYLATDQVGLYEKYGFAYLESRRDVWNEESRIYAATL